MRVSANGILAHGTHQRVYWWTRSIARWKSSMTQLPKFSDIQPETIEVQLDAILADNRQAIQQLLDKSQSYTWKNLMLPLEELHDRLHNFWSPISHLHAVKNVSPLREVYQKCLPKLSEYHTDLGQNEKLYQAIQSLASSKEYATLDVAQKKIIEHDLRDFKLAGVSLPPDKKKRFADLCKELSALTAEFENNVLDATQAFQLQIADEKRLSGIPQHALDSMAEAAKHKNMSGWLLTLDIPTYLAIITYADDRNIRQQLYQAFCTRASDQGPHAGQWDNSQAMQAILEKRFELAKLLDFKNFAENSLATNMVKSTRQVLDFLQQLVKASLPKAKHEYANLCQFAQENLALDQFQVWDIPYASEKYRQHCYAFSQEECRPYFPEYRVVEGLFTIVHKLYGVQISEMKGVDTWHPDVRCYSIADETNQTISYFYFDLYARNNKRGGAWMDDCRVRRYLANGELQLPVAYVNCNFSGSIGDDPALFTHNEVITLFHEFGHALQHMLTKMNYADVSGINGIPWDAIELASQFFENWAWEKESIIYISQHYKTKTPLPDELYQKMHRAQNFQSAMQMVRQLEFSLFDFRLHMEFDPSQENQIQAILDQVRKEVSVVRVPTFNRFQHSFAHIFAGGYAAGYYSYKWAEVMASDAFSLFKETGIFNSKTSKKFQETILEQGGSVEPMDLFIQFRGREPQIEALLKQTGIRGES